MLTGIFSGIFYVDECKVNVFLLLLSRLFTIPQISVLGPRVMPRPLGGGIKQ